MFPPGPSDRVGLEPAWDRVVRLEQSYQVLSGTLNKAPISNARLKGEEISFSIDGAQYQGRVNGNAMSGEVKGARSGLWQATRMGSHDH